MTSRPRRGYVMLAVLACLLVAGLAMTTLAQRSLQLSTIALERQRELQQQWGVISCQRTLLPAAPKLLDQLQEQAANRPGPAPATFSTVVQLGDMQFDLLLADENTKLNLNTAFHHQGRAGAERLVNRSLPPTYRPPVRLQPETRQDDPFEALRQDRGLPDALHSWGQVFDFSLAADAAGQRWQVPQLTHELTLWGRGQLNVRRASDATIIEACQLVVSQGAARRLQQELRDKPKHNVDQLVRRLNVDREKQLLLQEILTEHSSCFSLWIAARRTRIQSQRFSVMQVDEEGVTRTTEFVY